LNSREYLNSVELKTKENETEIAVKRQQIEDELIKSKRLKDELESKNKLVSDAQRLIEQKQSRLEVRLKTKRVSHIESTHTFADRSAAFLKDNFFIVQYLTIRCRRVKHAVVGDSEKNTNTLSGTRADFRRSNREMRR